MDGAPRLDSLRRRQRFYVFSKKFSAFSGFGLRDFGPDKQVVVGCLTASVLACFGLTIHSVWIGAVRFSQVRFLGSFNNDCLLLAAA